MQFSIIIPALNEERYIPGLLQDLVNQEEKNFEVILVDGHSQDKTKEVTKSFADRLPIRVFDAKKRNVSAQRNQGAEEAKSDYLFFLDADTRIAPHVTHRAAELIKKTHAQVVIPPIENNETWLNKIYLYLADQLLRLFLVFNHPFSAGGNMIVQKDIFKKVQGFDQTIFVAEDHDLIQRAHKLKAKVVIPRDFAVTFSLRRVENDGWPLFLCKMLYSTIYQFFHSKIQKPIYSYEMGGHLYKKK